MGGICGSLVTLALNKDSSAIAPNESALLERVQQLESRLNSLSNLPPVPEAHVFDPPVQQPEESLAGTTELADVEDDGIEQEPPSVLVTEFTAPGSGVAGALRLQPEYQKQQLVEAGFGEEEAAWIVQNESEIALQQLYDQYNARREAWQNAAESGQQRLTTMDRLRERIGDDYYEQYLEAKGWPTSVSIGTVIEGSPAQNAGLQPGDQVTAYDGSRVFNLRDVNRLTVQGELGESVLLEVERDGEPMQLTIPRGPIGISGRRGLFGR